MNQTKQFKLTKLIKIYGALIIIIFGLCLTFFNLYENYKNYKRISSEYITNIINSKKDLAKNIVLQTVSMIEKTYKDAIFLAHNKAKQHVYLAYNIVENLYNKLKKDLPNNKIEKTIIEAVRGIKFCNSSDYIFIVKTNGKVLLNTAYPYYEGKNFYKLKDDEGKSILKDMSNIALKKGEGFYSYKWFKPGEGKKYYRKISFIKYFKPLDFFIGNGIYIEEVFKEIKKDLLNKISGMRYEGQGYIFINKFDGTALITNGKIVKGNKKLWELFKDKKRKEEVKRIFQMEFKTVYNGKSGFMICNWEKLNPPHNLTKMLVYLYPIKKLQWIVGSGFFLDDVENFLNKERTKILNNFIKDIYFLIFITIIFVGIFLVWINKFGNLIEEEFEKFRILFENAIKNNIPIDENKIKFYRLRLFSKYANKLIKEKFYLSQKLKEEKEKLEITFNSVSEAIISNNTNGKIELMNPIAEKLTGWDIKEAKGKDILEILKTCDNISKNILENSIKKVLKDKKTVKLDNYICLVSKNDNKHYILGSLAPIKDNKEKIYGIVFIFQDVTEKLKQEEQLIKAEKLKALGILAGGIAHDFNNILTGISGNLSLIKLDFEKDDIDIERIKRRLDKIDFSIDRAIHLTHQLLTFSKGDEIVKENFDLKELIEKTIEFNLAGSNIKPIYKYNVKNFDFLGDKGKLSHVIANLVINAKQAMPNGGKIYITVDKVLNPQIEGEKILGEFFKISIKDEGKGIKKDILNKIFEPFFTTKESGTGLGLSIVSSIVKKHKGYLTVESEIGKGTEFKIYLPASIINITHEKKKEKNKCTLLNGKKVLIVDDQETILEIMKDMVEILGMECKIAKKGEEALKELKKEIFDLVITDLTIPGEKGGIVLISEIKKINPKIKVIISSGYSKNEIVINYKKYGFDGKLKKPFTIEELKTEINKIF